ncbi:MAG TPA: rhodanese-like domain-containing protein [Povalibacter sp.]|nr:rhodanese-like domain-containing protein [Povalibacter sp.]
MLWRTLIAAACLFVGAANAAETAAISQEALLKRLDAKDASLIVLDVRTPEEFAQGHVPGAINIPYTHLPARISELPSAADKDIVVYCTVGVRAERAASRLKENGFKRLLHLDGDMDKWLEKKRPLAK